ncbi:MULTISPECIES: hypothetical protein [Kordiimonas]|jgi:hypothetical protein|uniref:DUF3060 domain-containing protein n=1 Tax=Kordiimonas lacus TaxID=637679 RepID=A0A1G6WWS7_9PROT|nr:MULTISPECIES: hypothetical protein [Kordiimonas]SDD70348.1 hypothetical protein SAMN04488071_1250 [Kordiimonas lacus]
MTRNQLFIALAGGAAVLAFVSAKLTSGDSDRYDIVVTSDGDRVSVSGDEIEIEGRGGDVVVHTKDGTVSCKKNGGTIVVERSDGTSTEIICD